MSETKVQGYQIQPISGTWLPSLEDSGGTSSAVYSTQTGYYEKIGSLVHVWFHIVVTSFTPSGSSNSLIIEGLPFDVANTPSGFRYAGSLSGASGFTTGNTPIGCQAVDNLTYLQLYKAGTGVVEDGYLSNVNENDVSATTTLYGYCCYVTD